MSVIFIVKAPFLLPKEKLATYGKLERTATELIVFNVPDVKCRKASKGFENCFMTCWLEGKAGLSVIGQLAWKVQQKEGSKVQEQL